MTFNRIFDVSLRHPPAPLLDVTFWGLHALLNTRQPNHGENRNTRLENVSFKHETCKKVCAICMIFADRSR